MDLTLNILIIIVSFAVIYIFAKKGADSYTEVKNKIFRENDFYTEILLGLESAGRNVSRTSMWMRETRVAVWELYNMLRVQPRKENKGIVLHRKILETKQVLYENLEQARVNMEILPFLGIIGTLCGFAFPYLFKVSTAAKFSFQVSGLGFFLAASSTISALLALIYLKKKYEAEVMAKFDYYECQVLALEKILIEGDGFSILESWLHAWPQDELKAPKPQATIVDTEERQIDWKGPVVQIPPVELAPPDTENPPEETENTSEELENEQDSKDPAEKKPEDESNWEEDQEHVSS